MKSFLDPKSHMSAWFVWSQSAFITLYLVLSRWISKRLVTKLKSVHIDNVTCCSTGTHPFLFGTITLKPDDLLDILDWLLPWWLISGVGLFSLFDTGFWADKVKSIDWAFMSTKVYRILWTLCYSHWSCIIKRSSVHEPLMFSFDVLMAFCL